MLIFSCETAQQTAIYLLHYLASGPTDAPEYDLVLAKLLCGWPASGFPWMLVSSDARTSRPFQAQKSGT